jgi:hypothetical protein
MVENTPQQEAKPKVTFPGMDPTEHFQFYFRRHWIKLARYIGFLAFWMLMFIVLTAVSGVSSIDDDFTRHMTAIMLCMFFLIPHFIFITRLYKHFLTVVIVTDRKVHQFKRTLIAMDTQQSVDLWLLQDIDKLQRSIIQNVFGFGSLRLEAQNTQLRIHFVPEINKTYNMIMRLREAARRGNPVAAPVRT